MENNKLNKYNTKDIYLSAALIALGANYDSVDKSNPRQMIFYFTQPETVQDEFTQPFDFEKVERNWVNRILLVNARMFEDALKSLKSVVHSS